jgi:hypothetical protein
MKIREKANGSALLQISYKFRKRLHFTLFWSDSVSGAFDSLRNGAPFSAVIDCQCLPRHRRTMTNRETQMHTPNESSPMLKAIDLVRVNLDDMGLQDLQDHAADVLDTIAALNDFINGGLPKSHDSLLNALRLNRKLCLHLARLRDWVQARQSATAMAQAMPSASGPSLSGVPVMGRRSRVIRPLTSADNATSGPIQILSNDPQGRGTNAVWGGEAKEGGAHPQSGEASLQAKR